jgi:hypothetical protein
MEDKDILAFHDADSMISYLDSKEKNSEWIQDVSIEDCEFVGVENAGELPFDCNDAGINTVINGTQLFIKIPEREQMLPLRDCAMQSVYDRTRTRCGFVSALPVKRRAELLTEAASYINVSCRGGNSNPKVEAKKEKKLGILSVVDDKVSCFLSGNGTSNDYTIHSSTNLLLNTRDIVDSIGETQKFLGFYSYTGLDASWLTDKVIEDIDPESITDYYVEFHVATSDIGLGAISLNGRLSDGLGTIIPIGSKQKILHRRNTTKEDVLEALDSLLKAINGTKADMDKLKTVIVEYPVECLQHIVKELDLPLKTSLEIISNYKDVYGTGVANGYTLYLVLCQIIGRLEDVEPEAFGYRNTQERSVLKALSPKVWEKNDYPDIK